MLRSVARRIRRPSDQKGIKRTLTRAGLAFAPDHLDLVRMIAMQGADDAEMAAFFSVPVSVWMAWKATYPSFSQALEKGRLRPDTEVVVSLYKRCIGYDYEEDAAVGGRNPCVLPVKRHAPPDVPAIKYYLNNRTRSSDTGFRDTTRTEHTGANGGPIGIRPESRNDLIDAILALVKPKPDGPTKPQHETKR